MFYICLRRLRCILRCITCVCFCSVGVLQNIVALGAHWEMESVCWCAVYGSMLHAVFVAWFQLHIDSTTVIMFDGFSWMQSIWKCAFCNCGVRSELKMLRKYADVTMNNFLLSSQEGLHASHTSQINNNNDYYKLWLVVASIYKTDGSRLLSIAKRIFNALSHMVLYKLKCNPKCGFRVELSISYMKMTRNIRRCNRIHYT